VAVATLTGWLVLPAVACAGLKLGLPEPAAAPLGDSDVLGEVLSPGENEGDPAEVGVDPPVQAESAAEATMVVVPQPMTVNIALSPVPAMVVRTFMEPPHASRPVAAHVSRSQRRKPAAEWNTRDDPVAARVCRRHGSLKHRRP